MKPTREALFKKEILERDGNCCVVCKESDFRKLLAHHNDKRKDKKRIFDPMNCITLCDKCHANLHAAYPDYVAPRYKQRAHRLATNVIDCLISCYFPNRPKYIHTYKEYQMLKQWETYLALKDNFLRKRGLRK